MCPPKLGLQMACWMCNWKLALRSHLQGSDQDLISTLKTKGRVCSRAIIMSNMYLVLIPMRRKMVNVKSVVISQALCKC